VAECVGRLGLSLMHVVLRIPASVAYDCLAACDNDDSELFISVIWIYQYDSYVGQVSDSDADWANRPFTSVHIGPHR
jgi:hypothetical protein